MTATLTRFRVQNFRSVKDSGWIDSAILTALIGTNEAGKTNLLLPLWKLNPANDEPINPLVDYPRSLYSVFKSSGDSNAFIEAEFALSKSQIEVFCQEFKLNSHYFETILFKRYWNGKRDAIFQAIESFDAMAFSETLDKLIKQVEPWGEYEGVEVVKEFFYKAVSNSKNWGADISTKITELIKSFESLQYSAEEVQQTALNSLLTNIKRIHSIINNKGSLLDDDFNKADKLLPSFVYYSDYGNLNSEIYLPRVIEDLKRGDLKGIEKDKARTLKVLFEFVNLTPEQILELGKEEQHSGNKSSDTIEKEAEKKKEREILLQSASTKITREFRDWWKQGDYRFRFQADGNHFRIWVSDDRRPEEIELESRSRGLQWFFSFFLVFLVESRDQHSGCILLLDEPGVTLHPIAQEDLIKFFKSISHKNQVLYTTHSPFLIDSNNLSHVKAVFVDENGFSSVSTDLRKGSKVADKSIYPVHAAIGLSVSETFLNGCQPILVEGVSDQIYLHAIKNYLQKNNKISLIKELVFIPTGGVKGMKPIMNIISAKNNTVFPIVVLDSDEPGKKMLDSLENDLYKGQQNKLLSIDSFTRLVSSEVEDLMPQDIISDILDRQYRTDTGDYFSEEEITNDLPIIPQIEAFYKKHNLNLESGWKVVLAKEAVKRFEKRGFSIDETLEKSWSNLFEKILEESE